MRPSRIGFSCISVCHSSISASDFAVSVARKRSGPKLDQPRLRLAELVRAEALRSRREAMISVPPGSRMSSGVTMPLTVW